jgi:hypothetical protein
MVGWMMLWVVCPLMILQLGDAHRRLLPESNWVEHFSNWVHMSPEEALNYYTPFEVCRLYDLEDLGSSISCNSMKASIKNLPNECLLEGVGFGTTGTGCLRNRGAKYRHITTSPWLQSGNFRSVMNEIRSQGSNTMIFVGDSVTSQHVSDAFCNARREGFDAQFLPVSTYPRETAILPSFSINTHQKSGNNTIPYFQVIFLQFERLHFAPGMEVTYDPSQSKVFSSWLPFFNHPSIQGKVVFVVNSGLHDHNPQEYQVSFQILTKFLLYHAANHTLFFRETSAQHFDTETGEFPWNDKKFSWKFSEELQSDILKNSTKVMSDEMILDNVLRDTGQLTGSEVTLDKNVISIVENYVKENHRSFSALQRASYSCTDPPRLHDQNWRNSISSKILQDIDLDKHIRTLSFFSITEDRYDAHSRVRKDCSHYCNNPMLFLPVWNEMHNSLASSHEP